LTLLFAIDFNEKSKCTRSDNMKAYNLFAKMALPAHVENIIADEEE